MLSKVNYVRLKFRKLFCKCLPMHNRRAISPYRTNGYFDPLHRTIQPPPRRARSEASLEAFTTLPVTCVHGCPHLDTFINGQKVTFLVDTGSFVNRLSYASMVECNLEKHLDRLSHDSRYIGDLKNVCFQTKDRTSFTENFWVCKDGSNIVGLPFLQNYLAVIQFSEAVGCTIVVSQGFGRLRSSLSCRDVKCFINNSIVSTLLDTGSTSSFISSHLAQRIGLTCYTMSKPCRVKTYFGTVESRNQYVSPQKMCLEAKEIISPRLIVYTKQMPYVTIGCDVMKQSNMMLSFRENAVTFDNR